MFLKELYAGCMQETDLGGDIVNTIFTLGFWFCLAWWCTGGCRRRAKAGPLSMQQKQLRDRRIMMGPLNGRGLSGPVHLEGPYQEGVETNHASYDLNFDAMGNFMGTCNDADGLNQVVGGKIVWPGGQPGGEIVWCELRDQVGSEFTGRISSSGTSSTDPINIQATYVSNWNGLTQGSIQ